jgi:chemotaxis-related protein WspD
MIDTKDSTSQFFDRIPSQEYVKELSEALIKEPSSEEAKEKLSVLVFRLGEEPLAIQTIYVKEVARRRKAHRLPHRSSPFLLGLVNLNGELQLCIALHRLLEIEACQVPSTKKDFHQHERMIAIEKEGDLWVFPVDGIEGIFLWDHEMIENVPANILKSSANFLKGIVKMENKAIGFLNEEILFPGLKRCIL